LEPIIPNSSAISPWGGERVVDKVMLLFVSCSSSFLTVVASSSPSLLFPTESSVTVSVWISTLDASVESVSPIVVVELFSPNDTFLY